MKHPTEDLCCAEECAGFCGAVECSAGPGSPDACCADVIKTLGQTCGSATTWVPHATAPCVLPNGAHTRFCRGPAAPLAPPCPAYTADLTVLHLQTYTATRVCAIWMGW